MREIKADKNLVAYCGLYCGACSLYLKEKCEGCQKNIKATWCKLRSCCLANNFSSCSDCKDFPTKESLKNCKKFNNIFSKIFTLFFKSDRLGCIQRIREVGLEKFAREMAQKKRSNIV